ncbi:MAG: hypothetical protein H7329_07015 [Opitutaceae bacterium]|nr:hypothetical protein [Cytophagales bacterium]
MLEKISFNKVTPILTISGLYFWGYAQFFTGFSLFNLAWKQSNTDYYFQRNAGTGAKFYPIPVKSKYFNPYIGCSISTFRYRKDNAATLLMTEYPFLFGLTYSFKRGMLEIGGFIIMQTSMNTIYQIMKK